MSIIRRLWCSFSFHVSNFVLLNNEAMNNLHHFSKQVERRATKLIVSRNKNFNQLSMLEKETIVLQAKNRVEDVSLFVNLFFVISTSLFLLRFLMM